MHHIGILVADVAQARDRLVQQLGYVAESAIITDPIQTARVVFLRLPGADHWTELVAPDGPGSVLQGALKKRRGGAHHLCYEVARIEAACEQLCTAGMMLIAAPVSAVAFGGRRIAWLMDLDFLLVELVESGIGPLSLPPLATKEFP